MTPTPKTIQIFLPSGDPRGIRIAEITTRIVQVIEVSRSLLQEFLEMPESDQPILESALEKYLLRKRDYRPDKKKYDLAILVNPEDSYPPSDDRALKRFYKASLEAGFNTEFITKNDIDKLIQYDALFIRETTNVNHHTFRFAKKAESLGLAVIDDPESILKCTNKVYLHELLNANKILTPKSYVITMENCNLVADKMTFPFILKQPGARPRKFSYFS